MSPDALPVQETRTLTAEALVEQSDRQAAAGVVEHEVQVTLSLVEWRQLVGDIARRVLDLQRTPGIGITHLILAAGDPVNDLTRSDALTRLVQTLGMGTPKWKLTPTEAQALGVALLVAGEEPADCPNVARCGRVVTSPNLTTCGPCADRADLRVVGGAP